MPSKSKKQHNLMAAVANNPKFAKKVGIPQSVGEDYIKADEGRKFNRGGEMATYAMKALRQNQRSAVKTAKKENLEERKTLRSSMKEKDATGKDTRKAMQDLRGGQRDEIKDLKAGQKIRRGIESGKLVGGGFSISKAKDMNKAARAEQKASGNKMGIGKFMQDQMGGKKTTAPTNLPKAYTEAPATMKKGGKVKTKCMASGGLAAGHKSADGCATKGKTRAMQVKMAKGGMTKGCK